MSLIIAYIGKKGCVMASDKRRIGYFGNKEQLNAWNLNYTVVK